MRNKKGITLIALVVTIIVLIILAGVTINLLLGQDGIIKKAEQAKKDTEQAQANELAWLKDMGYYIDGYGPILKEVPEGYIPIYTKEDLAKVASGELQYDINGQKYDMLATSNYILMSNIDLKDYTGSDGNGWDPIMNIAGTFDGNGCVIDNLKMERTEATLPQALFVTIKDVGNVEIKNLTLNNININTDVPVAGILFSASTTGEISISNCKVKGNLKSSESTVAGIIVGKANTIKKCSVEADSMISKSSGIFGISAQADIIEECYVHSTNIEATGSINGIGMAPTIRRCNVEANSIKSGGSIYGISLQATTIEDCYVHSTNIEATGSINGIGMAPTIKKCNVEAEKITSKENIYGIGSQATTIEDCYVYSNNIEAMEAIYGIGEASTKIENCYVHSDNMKATNSWKTISGIGESPSIKRCSLKSNSIYAYTVYGITANYNAKVENCYTIMSADAEHIITIGGNNVINCYSIIDAKPEEMVHKFFRCIITTNYKKISDEAGKPQIIEYNMTNTYLNGLNKYSDGYRREDYTTETFYRTKDQLKDKATFEGWDENIWKFEPNINSGYPYLVGGERVVDKVEI